MADKKITIDELAIIINKGFDGQMEYMEKKFNDMDKSVNKRFDNVEKTLTAIKKDTANVVQQEEFDKLEGRVVILENTL